MSKLLLLVRRHVLAFVALFFVIGGSAYAVADGVVAKDPAPAKIYACAPRATGTLNLSNKTRRCAPGRHKISWNAQGTRGLTGLPGASGAAGATGLAGAVGPAGAKGDAGAIGAKGDAGARGDTGPAGADGAAGPRGATGTTGADGAIGPRGDTGAIGPRGDAGDTGARGAAGQSAVLTSGAPATLTTVAGGLPGDTGGLPLSGELQNPEHDRPEHARGRRRRLPVERLAGLSQRHDADEPVRLVHDDVGAEPRRHDRHA